MMFGREPFLVSAADEAEMQPGFSAWDYARERCGELCEALPGEPACEVRLSA